MHRRRVFISSTKITVTQLWWYTSLCPDH